jgi:phospholipase C
MRKSDILLITLATSCSSTNYSAPPTGYAPGEGGAALTDASTSDAAAPAGLSQVNHVVVIFLENWSFDSLYAEFQGADGLAGALAAPPQIDPGTGQPYTTLPQDESHMPAGLPNMPFALDPYLTVAEETSTDLTTNFYLEQE